ncbi:hypothetical protein WICMUC_000237 [Wickerhamomyces mucosus]|uniref:4a-hydroxytetrahydrobiopterin dehydratase n=1 Tax=Wickerhamomyces mucosus TaxID=1378264 RepID=A0A9P8PY11_9ASCO|nr:hypothetical protein WICMUC_000237 [Wickerhamomyces mucosus]
MINKITKIPVIKLSKEQLNKSLLEIPEWIYFNNTISRDFKFLNFELTCGFLNQILMRSHLLGHHPTITTTYNRVNILLQTHDILQVSDIDIKFAKKINEYNKIYNKIN